MTEVVHAENQQLTANIKETIESILVAFILAFIFRAFVVEAFVIPTGSMATTLLGAHMRYQCPDCGYVFDVDYRPPGDGGDDTVVPTEAMPSDDVYCPNCGYRVVSGPLRDPTNGAAYSAYDSQGRRLRDVNGGPLYRYPGGATAQPVRYGDRILVLKYAYLLAEPRRWDVVVFKAPAEPDRYKYTQNFIKRLVGKPGETLMVLDGSIYVRDSSGQWQIQQRPADVQEALWRVIYDNDYYPRGLPRMDRAKAWVQPWQPLAGSGWNLGSSGADGRVFRFSSQGQGTIAYNADAVPAGQTTNDYLAYDVPYNRRSPAGGDAPTEDRGHNTSVSDLKLAFWYQRPPGQGGSIKVLLSKRDQAFSAEITQDTATLWHTHADGTTTADVGPVKLADLGLGGTPAMWVQFMNVDYQVTLRLNGKTVLTTTARDYSPDIAALKAEFRDQSPPPGGQPRMQITASDQTCALSHISLWKNIYYTTSDPEHGLYWAMPDNPVHLHHRGDVRERGSGVYDDDEYFVMGDNSRFSADARYWRDPIDLEREGLNVQAGRVPGRFMLGKAFFVYWPAGFRPIAGWPALVPDFGDMRFIH